MKTHFVNGQLGLGRGRIPDFFPEETLNTYQRVRRDELTPIMAETLDSATEIAFHAVPKIADINELYMTRAFEGAIEFAKVVEYIGLQAEKTDTFTASYTLKISPEEHGQS